jgi:TolB protein
VTPRTRLLLLVLVMLSGAAAAQGPIPDVVLRAEKQAYEKIDVQIMRLEVLSGGWPAAEMADTLGAVIARDLVYSGLFRVGRQTASDSLAYRYTITGTVEGPLADGGGAEGAGHVVELRLLSYPEQELVLSKHYRPRDDRQARASGHHFANQVGELLTGEPGIALTRIVFTRGDEAQRDLYVVDYDGSYPLRLTANRTLNLFPSWSPDAKFIAFMSYEKGLPGIYLQRTATGEVERLIAPEGLNLGPRWHPTGEELLLAMSRSGDPEIYRIDLTGRVLRRLTVSPAIEVSPDWSPGGRDVVFTSDRTGTPQLYIMDADGASRRRLTFEGDYNDSAAWSPAGDQIVYACRMGSVTHLVLINSDGSNRRLLTGRADGSCEDPSWAPDGRHVVFASDRTGVFKLFVMDVVDGTTRQLTFGFEPDITPDWSP